MAEATRQLVRSVSGVPTVSVQGRFHRFVNRKRVASALNGSNRGGRWGPPGTFPVLYLTDTYESCVIEAYRHSTDVTFESDEPVPAPALALVGVDIEVRNILDLTTAAARLSVGLEPSMLLSEPQGPDGAAYEACSAVAQAAHQLERHGILVPSATSAGNTLAVFTDLLTEAELPRRVGGVSEWVELPPDPRKLRLVVPEQSAGDT